MDVFASSAWSGNPVAVVLDAEGLTDEEMARFARWTNLSETAFLLPATAPGADYRARIFTPASELPFAGHPTLGSCHAWLQANTDFRGSTVVQECGVGLVRVRRGSDGLAFAAPPTTRTGPVDPALVHTLINEMEVTPGDVCDARWLVNGPPWVGLLLVSADAVLAARAPQGPHYVGLVGLRHGGEPEVRAFFPSSGGTVEDPVTGSLNASLAEWLLQTGRVRAPQCASGRGARPRRAHQRHAGRRRDHLGGGQTVTRLTGRATF